MATQICDSSSVTRVRDARGPARRFKHILIAVFMTAPVLAHAADCPREGTLGTSRTLVVDTKESPRVGLKSFPHTLALEDKEVVLTFDDGPLPATTNKILTALAAECVQATFFIVGRNAQSYPQILKAEIKAGHTIGNHTWSHQMLDHLDETHALEEINKGFAADDAALGALKPATAQFFRFPYFASTPALLDNLQSRGVVVFGADLWASDWLPMTPQQELELLTQRLSQVRKGIILLHDTKIHTAAMLPAFLRYLKTNGYKVVHVVPAPLKAASAAPAGNSLAANAPQGHTGN
ncbi:MAG: polysaccharide deacetylase family protein [Xanthobacteraceae bacterium]|nr:polysaccharide deacetylase family protein [Xanthobacteraceae bacterium]